jgi:hypothetical protein
MFLDFADGDERVFRAFIAYGSAALMHAAASNVNEGDEQEDRREAGPGGHLLDDWLGDVDDFRFVSDLVYGLGRLLQCGHRGCDISPS